MAVGYASLVMLFLSIGFFNRLWSAFASVGKLALTNYFMQTATCTSIFLRLRHGIFWKIKSMAIICVRCGSYHGAGYI